MSGIVPLATVASALGRKASYVRRIAADQGRQPHSSSCPPKCDNPEHRRYPNATHERFPIFIKDGNANEWVVPAAQWHAHLRIRGRQWNQSV